MGPRKLKTVRMRSSRRTGPAWRMPGWKWGAKQKPMPDSSMQRTTPAGPRSTTTPKASSVSAEPLVAVALRLPCLHTRAPPPAATSAAAVETLKAATRRWGLPPVPHVSMTSPETGSGSAASSMAAKSPQSSSCDAPFVRRATRKALICEGRGPQQLQAHVRRFHGHLGGVVLGHREVRHPLIGELPLVGQGRGPVGEQAGGLDLGGQLGDLPLDALEVGDRLAEGGALLDVLG